MLANNTPLQIFGNTFFILSPCIGYLPQLFTKKVVFSPLLSLIIILSSLSKFYFFFYSKFSVVIVLQSVLSIFIQLALIYNYKMSLGAIEEKIYMTNIGIIKKKNLSLFNKKLIFIFTFIMGMNSLAFIASNFLFIFAGYLSLFLEFSVGFLQYMIRKADKKNELPGSEKRMPKELFICWMVGDLGRMVWLWNLNAPMLFVVAAGVQAVVDVVLILDK